ncbi:peptidase c14 caspase catalytic subunit p20 [Fusarium longipes]|uniref:Peptidase c14 caspase catalytic subunit p20 n=1 Tax=Fusarium longipes TaxID=694270 RepID=A0A395S523_9HYPO|nr:peptidase c14 caspase catalytic subunit p20 [Fusarium longipes]
MAYSEQQKEDGPAVSRALLIGCPAYDLPAVPRDLIEMRTILESYGFVCKELQDATRHDIFQAWDQMIEETSANDTVTIYYSGHGGFSQTITTDQDGNENRPLQYLVPVDFQQTTENDWRGITDVELSEQLLKTTRKTDNVTIILDCCHAARMARMPGRVKSIDPRDYQQVIQHIETMQIRGRFTGSTHHERNPSVLTLSASTNTGAAYETTFGDIEMSCLVHALKRFLARDTDPDRHPSWRTVMLGVRELMKVTSPHQFPQIEGNDRRLAFRVIEAEFDGVLTVDRDHDSADTLIINGGSIHGVKAGDIYSLQPRRNERAISHHEITKLTVTDVGANASRARLDSRVSLGQDQWEQGLKAFLLSRRRLDKLPVSLQGPEMSQDIRRTLDGSRYVKVVDDGDVLARVVCDDSRIQLFSNEGPICTLLRDCPRQEKESHDRMLKWLESLARARHVLTLDNGDDAPQYSHVEVEIGSVRQGFVRHPWSEDVPNITVGDNIYLSINNNSPVLVHVWIFSICAEKVEYLSTLTPRGRPVPGFGKYIFGRRDFTGQVIGNKISWPSEVPMGNGVLSETILVILGDGEADLRGLVTNAGVSRGPGDELCLDELIDELSPRSSRDTEPETTQHINFEFRRFTFQVKA